MSHVAKSPQNRQRADNYKTPTDSDRLTTSISDVFVVDKWYDLTLVVGTKKGRNGL